MNNTMIILVLHEWSQLPAGYAGLDKGQEDRAHGCLAGQAMNDSLPVASLHPWMWPEHPWQKIHMDKTYPLVTDAHAKWPEIIEMNSITS